MKILGGLLAALLFAAPATSFFRYERALPASGAGQHYIVVNEAIWQHARADLGDLRIVSANGEIPYVLDTERGGAEIEQQEIRVLQPVTVAGKTQFVLDMAGIAEYDRVSLRLSSKNFLAHARISGQDDLHGQHWALLGTTTLYDLSDENLGHNSTLQIPLAAYKYLQVVIDGSVKPGDVLGGNAGITRSEKAIWRQVGSDPVVTQNGKNTVLAFTVPKNAPVEKIVFDIDPAQPNFRRDISIETNQGGLIRSGELVRVHMQRGGQKIDVDGTYVYIGTNLATAPGTAGQGTLKAVVHNGDDLPLKITGAHLQQYERRIYFEGTVTPITLLLYGDEKLAAPVYDYAKFFQKDAAAAVAAIGPESANANYTGHPDERPWSERHPALLWGAILAAVMVLGSLAIRSMRSGTV